MDTEQNNQVLEFIAELQDAQEEYEKAKAEGKKKTAMKKLNYLFSPAVSNRIKSIFKSGKCTNFSESEIARAAMYLGLSELEKMKDENSRALVGSLHLARLRSSLGK